MPPSTLLQDHLQLSLLGVIHSLAYFLQLDLVLFFLPLNLSLSEIKRKNLEKVTLSTWRGMPLSSPKTRLAKPESSLCSRSFKPTVRRKGNVYHLWHCALPERAVLCLREITLPWRRKQQGPALMCVSEGRCSGGSSRLQGPGPDHHPKGTTSTWASQWEEGGISDLAECRHKVMLLS